MNKKIILISIVAIVIVSMAYAGVASVIKTKENTREESSPIEFNKMYSIENLSFIEAGAVTEGNLCLVAPKGKTLTFYKIILDKYIYSRKVRGRRYPLTEMVGASKYIEKYDEDTIELYNFRTGEVERTIDFANIAEEYTPGKQFRFYDAINAKVIDSRPYLEWRVYPIEDPYDYDQSQVVTYDLEEEEVVDYINVAPSPKYTEEEREYFRTFYIIADRRCNFLEVNGFSQDSVEEGGVRITYLDSWQNGIIAVEMLASLLPKSNARLYAEFPKLKEYDIKEWDRVKLFFSGYPNAEDVLGMLIEDGREISYEGCTLDWIVSVDGKQHEISSMEDYIQWYDWKEYSVDME